jgi:hypothetical protein
MAQRLLIRHAERKGVKTMAWGMLMTFVTLFGMMVLAMHEASASVEASEHTTLDGVPEAAKPDMKDLRKAA